MTTHAAGFKAFKLARWFTQADYVNGPEDGMDETGMTARERILADLYHAERVAVHGDTVLVKTPNGACMIERETVEGCELVTFDYVEDARWTHTAFWMNASSVTGLGDHLRTVPRAEFNDLFFGPQVAA
jgi:hypothetical protein